MQTPKKSIQSFINRDLLIVYPTILRVPAKEKRFESMSKIPNSKDEWYWQLKTEDKICRHCVYALCS